MKARRLRFLTLPLIGGLIAGVAAFVFLKPAPQAHAGTVGTSSYAILSFGSREFPNWDFNGETASRSNVDMPVDLLFYNNATVSLVEAATKALGYDGSCDFGFCSNEDFEYSTDSGSSWQWNPNGGDKTGEAVCSTTRHVRFHAPSVGYFNSPTWGYMIVATTHRDHNEPSSLCSDTYYNDPEGTEEAASNSVMTLWAGNGDPTYLDWADFHNYWQGNTDSNHIMNSDGYATYICVGSNSECNGYPTG